MSARVSSVAAPTTGVRHRTGRTLIGSYAVLVFLLVSLNFALPRALPGQPIAALSDPRSELYVGDDTRRAAVEGYYGLDRPLADQYGQYLAGLVRGDLGTSIRFNRPVTEVIGSRLPWTLLLLGTSLVVATGVGVLGGVHSAWRRGGRADRRLLTFFLAVDNFPVFFLASVAAYLLAVSLGWFPLSGARTPFSESWMPLRQAVDIAHHLVLPAAALTLQLMGFQYLVMRASMVTELGSGHLLLGRAKGLSERVLKYRYAARNALLPSVTVFALQLGFAVTAAIFVETVFAYPGLGSLMVESVGERDYPTMQGCFLVLTVLVVGANLFADIAYRRLDPRVST
ncbi:MAG: ABC transporter permease [Actinomycetota bacterium]|nr:ABC transporter permease [Actinomycetota bacterium]